MSFTILIVDDDSAVRDQLRWLLERQGYHILMAADGAEALDRVDEEMPGLILLDLLMPGMDGFKFAEEFQRRGLRSLIPVISLSGYGDNSEMGKLSELLGAVGYVRKPFSSAELLKEVRRFAPVAEG